MEVGKLLHALDQILRRCKAAGHRLHVFDPDDISHEEVVGRGEEGIVQLCKVNFHGLQVAIGLTFQLHVYCSFIMERVYDEAKNIFVQFFF